MVYGATREERQRERRKSIFISIFFYFFLKGFLRKREKRKKGKETARRFEVSRCVEEVRFRRSFEAEEFEDGGSSSKRSKSSKKFCFEEVSKMREKNRKRERELLEKIFIFLI